MLPTRRLTVGITMGLVVGFVALFVIVGMTFWLGERAGNFLTQTDLQRDVRVASVELRDALRTAESSQRGFLLTGNEVYLAPYDTATIRARQYLSNLKHIMAAARLTAPMLPSLTSAVTEKIGEMDRSIQLKNAGHDEEALALIRTNRGKILMDEANVFLYGVILAADEQATRYAAEQRQNALMLRWISLISTLVIIFVVVAVTATVRRNARELRRARDEVSAANLSLEKRVQDRTADLSLARERAEILLSEVNHRVANSLQLVGSLIKMQSRAVKDDAARDALTETQVRIDAISLVHKSLYASGDVKLIRLHEYLDSMLKNLETAMQKDGHAAALKIELEPITLPTDASISLAVAVTELVTNAYKYAYPGSAGEIRVKLRRVSDSSAELLVEDDGIGFDEISAPKGTGLGSKIVNIMASALQTHVDYRNRAPGTTARMTFSTGTA